MNMQFHLTLIVMIPFGQHRYAVKMFI